MKRKIDPLWGILTIALTVLGLVLCGIGAKRGALLVKTDTDPRAAAETFFESVEIGKYEAAYACLDGVESLGLEYLPALQSDQAIRAAMVGQFSAELYGDCSVDGETAYQQVNCRYFDLDKLEGEAKT
ncbi:MAG: hypothetical protein IIT33_03375, partial [Prevotella sp.]|nr:hypothetical protein [Prevotella sp.]